jgi:hypothetical protein
MAKDISFMQYMRAHGNTPGPTQKPLLTGLIGGFLAAIPAASLVYYSGALESIARFFGLNPWFAFGFGGALITMAGMLYAAIFKRAANDYEGGWLFGAAFGFLLWMFAPVTLWQLFISQPIVAGRAAMGLFAAHLLYGFVLGIVFPYIHRLVQIELRDAPKNHRFRNRTFSNFSRREL